MNNNIPLTDVDAPLQEPEDQLELASIHDFATKLVQPGAKEALEAAKIAVVGHNAVL